MNGHAAHQKTYVIAGFLVLLSLFCWWREPVFLSAGSIGTVLKYAGLYGILAVGVSFVIMTGGIDLSIGSWIGLTAVTFPVLLRDYGMGFAGALALIILASVIAGLLHGLLVTRLYIQPFLVTLCGLFIYRGLARIVSGGREQILPEPQIWMQSALVSGRPIAGLPIPAVFFILLALSALMAVFLNRTVMGRHLLAVGRNEQAARFSGVATGRVRILAFVICSVCAGIAGVLFLAESRSALGSSFGSFYELWAIAGAVLGGCSLRGGECTMTGVLLGSLMVSEVRQAVLFLAQRDEYKEFVIGIFVLFGVVADVFVTQWLAKRRV